MNLEIESPILREIIAEARAKRMHRAILGILNRRFGAVPPEVRGAVTNVTDDDRLQEVIEFAAIASDLAAFGQGLGA